MPRAAPGAHPGRGPRGEAREGERRRLAPERCSSSRVLFHEWINDGQARWSVDEQRSGSAGCGSAGKAGSPPVGAMGMQQNPSRASLTEWEKLSPWRLSILWIF